MIAFKSLFPLLGFAAAFLLTASYAQAHEEDRPLAILAMGDSTTAGTPGFLSPVEFSPHGSGDEKSQYVYWIHQKHPSWTVWNRGVRGQRTDQILWRMKRDIESHSADIVVLLGGVNDLYQGYPVDFVKKNLQAMYEAAVQKKMKALACTILPFDGSGPDVDKKIKQVNDWIHSYAKEHRLLFCDTHSLLEDPKKPGHLSGSPDRVHPDVAGYRKMGEAIAETIEKSIG